MCSFARRIANLQLVGLDERGAGMPYQYVTVW